MIQEIEEYPLVQRFRSTGTDSIDIIEENFKKDSGAFIASITTGQRANMDEELEGCI